MTTEQKFDPKFKPVRLCSYPDRTNPPYLLCGYELY